MSARLKLPFSLFPCRTSLPFLRSQNRVCHLKIATRSKTSRQSTKCNKQNSASNFASANREESELTLMFLTGFAERIRSKRASEAQNSENNLEIVDLLDISRDTLSKVGRALTVTNNWHSFSGHTYYLASWQLSYDRIKLGADEATVSSQRVSKSVKSQKPCWNKCSCPVSELKKHHSAATFLFNNRRNIFPLLKYYTRIKYFVENFPYTVMTETLVHIKQQKKNLKMLFTMSSENTTEFTNHFQLL